MQILGIIGPIEMLLGFFSLLIPLGILILIFLIVSKWVNNSISVRKEQNELLRELIKVLEKKN